MAEVAELTTMRQLVSVVVSELVVAVVEFHCSTTRRPFASVVVPAVVAGSRLVPRRIVEEPFCF